MPLTQSQADAVAASGNVIVVAGAGTGKTSTLVARCLEVLRQGGSLDRILMVTFTEAAAAEMRHRLRQELQRLADAAAEAEGMRYAEQLALVETARISTMHSQCLRLVQGHFHELGLDPEVRVLDEQQARALAEQAMEALFTDIYRDLFPDASRVRELILAYGQAWDDMVRQLVLKIHRFSQTLPDPAHWMQDQQAHWNSEAPAAWPGWLAEGFRDWRAQWQPVLEPHAGVANVARCLAALETAGPAPSLDDMARCSTEILAAHALNWPRGTAGKVRDPLKKFFEEAAFLASLAAEGGAALQSDWGRVAPHMAALLSLASGFTQRFTRAKRELGGVDFSDLEQLTLRLLRNAAGGPTPVAQQERDRTAHVFVDECQDINAAQDAILRLLSREGGAANRFLVGDVKQSIYQFRLADPQIFRGYEQAWGAGAADTTSHGTGTRILLSANHRSRPGILDFVNALFGALLRDSVGGVAYEPLEAGEHSPMRAWTERPCVELHLLGKPSGEASSNGGEEGSEPGEDLSTLEREARLVAQRLRALKLSGLVIHDKATGQPRTVQWRDMAVLLRAPASRTEAFAKEFHRAGIPLAAARGGFLDASEVSDLVCLLQVLDNPLQDIPLLAVLRSPLVGLTLDELATIRTASQAKPFWRALRRLTSDAASKASPASSGFPSQNEGAEPRGTMVHEDGLRVRLGEFLARFERWRELVRQVGPSLCLEQVLTDTGYDVWLSAQERGAQQLANVRLLLELARQFDPYLRQGLYRFLRHLKALEEDGDSLEPAPVAAQDAVQLMSIHRSKGLEFPVVVLAGLGSRFNFRDLQDTILLDSLFGLAPKAATPNGGMRYPTLPCWLAIRRQRVVQLGEELRLLYVAATRARDRLILTGTAPRKYEGRWLSTPGAALTNHQLLAAQTPLDWLMPWLPTVSEECHWDNDAQGCSPLLAWERWDAGDPRLSPQSTSDATAPGGESCQAWSAETLEALRARLDWRYGHEAATRVPAKSSVSALRRRAAELAEEDAVRRFPSGAAAPRPSGDLSAIERGILHHRFQQFIHLAAACDAADLAAQRAELVKRGVFTPAEAGWLDLAALAAFWQSEVGRSIRDDRAWVRRELPFTVRLAAPEAARILGTPPDPSLTGEFVVIQGVVDLAVVKPDAIGLLDFKTDRVRDGELEARVASYRPQVQLYALALEKIYRRPVTRRWLHFFETNRTLEVN